MVKVKPERCSLLEAKNILGDKPSSYIRSKARKSSRPPSLLERSVSMETGLAISNEHTGGSQTFPARIFSFPSWMFQWLDEWRPVKPHISSVPGIQWVQSWAYFMVLFMALEEIQRSSCLTGLPWQRYFKQQIEEGTVPNQVFRLAGISGPCLLA